MNITSSKYYVSLFLIIITFLFSTQRMSCTTDAINTSHILRDGRGDTLISSSGSFELGFFSPQNSKNRYVGIWYKKKITIQTVVWVANRENPLTDRSGTLRVNESAGCLVLLNGANGTIWSTNASRSVRNPVAQLLDSGNLVVKDANDAKENFLWESFNYPTDTLLPGMKLGWNFMTGLEVYITSWKNSGDPASGDYTFHNDPTDHPQQVLKKGGLTIYRTGPWNGIGFSGNPNLKKNPAFTFGMVINKEEVYYYYELRNDSVITRFTLAENGVGLRWIWEDQRPFWTSYLAISDNYCDMYKRCGPYSSCNIRISSSCGCLNKFQPKDPQGWDRGNWSEGCTRRTPFVCQRGDAFLKYPGMKLPDTEHSWSDNSMTRQECEALCWKNCSCTAYASLDISRGKNGCLLWFGDLVDIREMSTGQDIYIRMDSSELGSKGGKREIAIVTLSLLIGVLLLCLSLFLCSKKRKKLDRHLPETGGARLTYVDNRPNESHDNDLELPLFDLFTITKATESFSINNKLGEGGFGPVYKGVLGSGQEIAVKRLSRTSLQGVDEFRNEVICIAKLQHRNLVKLLGCCIQGDEKMLIYEYMTNKSLDLILFDPTKSILLDWPRRFGIINGIARGLLYLHQDSRFRVIHRDLKASNILLDSDMNPKISDFGLARTFGGNDTGGNTNRVVGTHGYISPEYAVDGLFSVKSDVFSFGVLVLEIVSGKRNRGFARRHHRINLLGHAWMLYRDERSVELVDYCCLRDSCHLPEVLRSIHVGLLCVQEHQEDRPSMSSVVLMLSNDGVLPEANHPGFFTGREILKTETTDSLYTASSPNEMTISLLDAR